MVTLGCTWQGALQKEKRQANETQTCCNVLLIHFVRSKPLLGQVLGLFRKSPFRAHRIVTICTLPGMGLWIILG